MNAPALMRQLKETAVSFEGSSRRHERGPSSEVLAVTARIEPFASIFAPFPAGITRVSWGSRTPSPLIDMDNIQWHMAGDHQALAQMYDCDPVLAALLSNYRLINETPSRPTWKDSGERHGEGPAASALNLFVTKGGATNTVAEATTRNGTVPIPPGSYGLFASYHSTEKLSLAQCKQMAKLIAEMAEAFPGSSMRGCVVDERRCQVPVAFAHFEDKSMKMCGPHGNGEQDCTAAEAAEAFYGAYLPLRSGSASPMAYLAVTIPRI